MNKLFSNLAISYLASFLGFITILASARLLGVEQFYWVALGIAVGGFIIPLASLGSERTFVRDAVAANDASVVEKLIISSFCIRVTTALMISLILFIGSFLYTDSILDGIAISCFSLWSGLQGLYPSSWFDYLHVTRRQNIIILGERFICVMLVAWVYNMPSSFQVAALLGALLLISRISSIVVQVHIWWKYYGISHFRFRLSFPGKKIPGINYRVTLTLVANALFMYGNQLILGNSNSSIELPAYSLAFQIVSLIFLFQSLAVRLLSRQIAEVCSERKGVLSSVIHKAGIIGGGSIILAVGALIVSKFLPLFLNDDRFELMSQFMPLLCIWVVVMGAGQSITQHLLALHQESFYLLSGVFGGLIAFTLGLIYVPIYGGIAVAAILLLIHGAIIIVYMLRLVYVVFKMEDRI